MSEYILLAVAVPAAVYAFSYAKSLWEDGNHPGVGLVLVIIGVSLLLPVYRIMVRP